MHSVILKNPSCPCTTMISMYMYHSCNVSRASLYERPVNLEAAKKAHTEFRRTMRAAGLKVLTIRDILSFGVEDHMGARVELEELATHALQYEMAKGFKLEDMNKKVFLIDLRLHISCGMGRQNDPLLQAK